MRNRLVAPLLAVALVACSDSTGPRHITGAYRLSTIAGLPLPVLVGEERLPYPGTGVMGVRREYVDAMRLVLPASAPDTFQLVRHVTWELDAGEDPARSDLVVQHTEVVRGDTLCIRTGNFDDVDGGCPASQLIRRKGDGIVVQFVPPPIGTTGRVEYLLVRDTR